MTTLLITLADFPAYLPFSVNIKPELVNPYIRDAQKFDLWPLLPEALRTVLATPAASWPAATTEFFNEYVKPLLVCQAAAQFLLWHGTHVTPAGLEELVGDGATRTPTSPTRRAALSASVQAKVATYRPLLEAALRTTYPAGATRCASSTRRRVGRSGSSFSTL